jgi:hypothetical protein
MPVAPPEPLPRCDHRFTHIDATYLPYLVDVEAAGPARGSPDAPDADAVWVGLAGPVDLALPVAQRRILDSVRNLVGCGLGSGAA